MKKMLMITLCAVLALGLTVPAFAIHPSQSAETVPLIGKTTIEIGGSLRFRGDYRSSIISSLENPVLFTNDLNLFSDLLPADQLAIIQAEGATGIGNLLNMEDAVRTSDNKADYDGRVRLWLNAYVTDNTMGRIHLETGGSNASDTYQWGCGDRDPAGTYNEGNCKKDELRVLEAWIKHEIGALGMPAGFKVGHYPIKLGRGLFLNHTRFGDDAVNFYIKPSDNFTAEFLYSKFTENSSIRNDDTDAYSILANYSGDTFNIGGDVTYARDQNYVEDLGISDPPAGDHSGDATTELWNVGIRGDVDVADWNIYGDVEFQFGSIPLSDIPIYELDGDYINPITGLGPDDQDYKGYAVVVGTNGKIGDFNLNAEFGYGSGDDDGTDGDMDMYQTSLSSIKKFTYVYDYRMMTAALGQNTGIANTTYVKIGGSAKVSPDVKVGADLYWLQASEDVLDEDELGWELDANASYQIDKNLHYFIEGGVLFTGDFYDNFDPSDDADDAYVVRHGIQLSF